MRPETRFPFALSACVYKFVGPQVMCRSPQLRDPFPVRRSA